MPEAKSGMPGGQHALVVGAGVAGLLAARVLADHFPQVSVLEQDPITADTEYRRGVPQARHPHALLARGASILEMLFPGLRAELAEQGAPIFDLGEPKLLFPSGWAPSGAIGISAQTFTRATLERGIRRRVLALPNVTIRGEIRVENLCWTRTQDRSRVTGVRTLAGPRSSRQVETIEADLVIDASGRTSKLPAWLVEVGFPAPGELVVEGNLSYSSRLYRIPPGTDTNWTSTGEITYAPHVHRAGSVVTVEKGRWLVTLIGAGGEITPTDDAGFLAYAQSLRNPHIATSIAAATPITPIYRMLNLNNRWTLFHQMHRWPDRLLCLGDVVCALNPVYGQGMTLAAVQALVLSDLLDRRHRIGNLTGLARIFQHHTARTLHLPWLMATSSDLFWNPNRAPLLARLSHWYFDQLLTLLPDDLDIYRRFFQAAHMLKGPSVLLHPSILSRIAAASARRRVITRTRPQPADNGTVDQFPAQDLDGSPRRAAGGE